MASFVDRIRELRQEMKLSLRQLSRLTDISPSAIHSYEMGVREPSYKSLLSLSKVFNCSIEYLLGESSVKNQTYENVIDCPDDENPLMLRLDEIMEKSSIDTQLAICEYAESIAEGKILDVLTEQEKTLVRLFREASEEGKMRMIQSMLNIHDAEIKSSDSAGNSSLA